VLCALEGRSESSRRRAKAADLVDAGSVKSAVAQCEVLLSICPPHGALGVAREVAALGFRGLYVDANAIAPATAREACAVVEAAGASFVDGGLFGGPPTAQRPVTLYVSGPRAKEAAALFDGSCVHANALDAPVGAASALKACFASWTKGTWLLLASILATAEEEGVGGALREMWGKSHPQLLKTIAEPSLSPGKAWRWLSEMQEIPKTYGSAGQPVGFFQAAEEICRRLEHYKDTPDKPSLEQVLGAVRRSK
jgi:hypothetical protein